MNSTNKKASGARGIPQPFNRQAEHAPQHKPVVAQLKTGVSAQSVKRPVAPPAYRPQATPNAAQPKMANGAVNRKPPVAPPVYRPQQVPKVLQTKSSPAPSPQTGQSPRQPVAPPVYRPEANKLVQPKAISLLRKSHTAPPVYRPEQKRIAQAKMAAAANAHTLPKAPPIYRPQAKQVNAPPSQPAQMGSKMVAPPTNHLYPVRQQTESFSNKNNASVQLKKGGSRKARIRRARRKEKERVLREPALPQAPQDPDTHAWQKANVSATSVLPGHYTTEKVEKTLGDGATALTTFPYKKNVINVAYDPEEASMNHPHKRIGQLSATFTHELAVHGKNALAFADPDEEHGAMHDPETRTEYLNITHKTFDQLDNATQKRAFARAWLSDMRNQIVWHPSPEAGSDVDEDEDEDSVSPLGKGEKRARHEWANRRYRDMMKAIKDGTTLAT